MENLENTENPDWFLKAWMKKKGKRQIDLFHDLGWERSHANKIYHSQQSYRRQQVNEIAAWLQIEPFELFIEPDTALEIRSLRDAIRAGNGAPVVYDVILSLLKDILAETQAASTTAAAIKKVLTGELRRSLTVSIGPPYIRPDRRK